MSKLISQNPIAHSLLFSETLYLLDGDKASFNKEIISNKLVEEQVVDKLELVYQGNSAIKLLIVVNENGVDMMAEDDWEALKKTLNALQIQIDNEVAFINLSLNEGLNLQMIDTHFSYTHILFFGINPTDLNFQSVLANTITTINNKRCLATWPMQKIRESAEKKSIFWREIKNLMK